jgi:hypothetical protein
MNITLDGHVLFDEQDFELQTGSFSRDSLQRSVHGLDGVLSIDLGLRSRQIIQKGSLQAKSRTILDKRISAISAFIDGDIHKLLTGSGREYDNLRMDVFKVSNERISSIGVTVDYEIVYTQLNI